MHLIRPFAGLRPAPGQPPPSPPPPTTCCPPTRRASAPPASPGASCTSPSPRSICRPAPIPHAPEVYAKGEENFERMLAEGVLAAGRRALLLPLPADHGRSRADRPGRRRPVADYDTNRIRKHEFTRPDKEDDRVRQIDALERPDRPGVPRLSSTMPRSTSSWPRRPRRRRRDRHHADDGVRHSAVGGARCGGPIAKLTRAFDAMAASTSPTATTAPPPPRAWPRRARPPTRPHGRRATTISCAVIFPAQPDADPRLQPRAEGPERRLRREQFLERIGEAFTVETRRRRRAAGASTANSACTWPASGTGSPSSRS